MSQPYRMELNETPETPNVQTPAGMHSSVLDMAAELGKVQPEELHFGDGMTLAMVYGAMRSIVEGVRTRRLG